MLTLPDLKEKQILFIQTDKDCKNKIKFWNNNIKFYKNEEVVNQTTCSRIFSIFIVGDISITSYLVKNCQNYGISIFLLDYKFREYGNILAQTEGNYLLRSKQYLFSDDLNFSRNLISNKIINQFYLICKNPSTFVERIKNVKNYQELLGIEGSASKEFFIEYFGPMKWKTRLPQTRIDVPNFLLDIGYYYLFNFIDSTLRLFGFDTYKGIYHQLFFQRRSLACDIMEPFRFIVERQILKSFNLKHIQLKDFQFKNGKFELKSKENYKYCKIFCESILEHRTEIYEYIKRFYYCMLNDKQSYPVFVLKDNKVC